MDELCLGHGLWLVNANEIVFVSVGVGKDDSLMELVVLVVRQW
jgi:hypothetical protein